MVLVPAQTRFGEFGRAVGEFVVEAKCAALEDQLAGSRIEEVADWPAEEIRGQGCVFLDFSSSGWSHWVRFSEGGTLAPLALVSVEDLWGADPLEGHG